MNRIEYAGLTFVDDDGGHDDERYEIKTASCHKVCALLSDALEVDTFDAELISATPLTPFTRNDPLTWYHRDRLIGTYYIQHVKRISANKYRLEATSAVGLLMQTDHYGGIYTGQTVAEVIADICTVPYAVKTSLRGIKLYGWLPIASRRDNLSQVLFAIGATAKTDYNGVLRVEGLWDGVSNQIDDNRVFMGDSVEYAADVTEVVVLEHQYVEGAEDDTLFDGTALQGDIITFSEPMHTLTAQGFTVLESGANYARLSAGSGTLTGKKYIHTTRAVSKPVGTSDQPNAITVKEATLVSLANSEAVAVRLVNYYASVQTVEHDVVHQSEMPGDVVTLNHPYDDVPVTGCIESTDMNLSGMLRASQRVLLGYSPPDIGEAEYYDTAEIITEDGTWVVPRGVTSVRAVLIGGGDVGASGADGEAGGNPVLEGSSDGTYLYTPGLGGAGGEPGTGGVGGKIYQESMAVRPGQSFHIQIGVGGDPLHPATATTLNEHTSENGSGLPDGYLDPFTGEIFAAAGELGIAGGDGGDGGNGPTYEDGKAGRNVQDFQGGIGGKGARGSNGPDLFVQMGGGGGSGAAHGIDGTTGNNATCTTDGFNAVLGAGADGVGAVRPQKAPMRGRGGTGGNGGSGGGGTGGYRRKGRAVTQVPAAVGGLGSDGGDGGDGCVIIYYSTPKPGQRGAVKDKNGLLIRDRYTRQLVV